MESTENGNSLFDEQDKKAIKDVFSSIAMALAQSAILQAQMCLRNIMSDENMCDGEDMLLARFQKYIVPPYKNLITMAEQYQTHVIAHGLYTKALRSCLAKAANDRGRELTQSEMATFAEKVGTAIALIIQGVGAQLPPNEFFEMLRPVFEMRIE